jgi:hypothetical protein
LGSKKNLIIDGFKICPKCGERKNVETEYYKAGVYQRCMSWCKTCCSECKPQDPAYWKQYYQKNKEKRKSQDRERHYGVTQEMFDFVFYAQGRICGICESNTPGGKGGWHTDHDHTTGQFRGVLCCTCNALVSEKNTPEILQKAIEYLESQKIVEVK